MVLKHLTQSTEKNLAKRRSKIEKLEDENRKLKTELEKKTDHFDDGFALALILLCQSYPPLHEHAFNIFEEAGYSISDFTKAALDPDLRETLNHIFSI